MHTFTWCFKKAAEKPSKKQGWFL